MIFCVHFFRARLSTIGSKKEFIDDDNSFPIMPVVMERQTTLEVS